MIDKGDPPWGRSITTTRDGFVLDRGADAVAESYRELFDLATDLGIGDQLLPVSKVTGTVRGGRVRVMNPSATAFLRSDLLSWPARLRLVAGMPRQAVQGRTEALEVRESEDRVEIDVRGPDGAGRTLVADGCVLATMLEPAAAIHRPTAEATRELRAELEYIKLIKTQLAFSVRTDSDAFIVLSPPREEPKLMGMFLDHNKCPDRAPAGHSLLSVYADTAASTALLDRPDDEVIGWAHATATRLLPELDGHLLFAEVTRWPLMGAAISAGGTAAARLVELLRAAQPHARTT